MHDFEHGVGAHLNGLRHLVLCCGFKGRPEGCDHSNVTWLEPAGDGCAAILLHRFLEGTQKTCVRGERGERRRRRSVLRVMGRTRHVSRELLLEVARNLILRHANHEKLILVLLPKILPNVAPDVGVDNVVFFPKGDVARESEKEAVVEGHADRRHFRILEHTYHGYYASFHVANPYL